MTGSQYGINDGVRLFVVGRLVIGFDRDSDGIPLRLHEGIEIYFQIDLLRVAVMEISRFL